MSTRRLSAGWLLALAAAGLAVTVFLQLQRTHADDAGGPRMHRSESPHYVIRSAATPARTREVVAAVEALHRAYRGFFAAQLAGKASARKHQLLLYRDQAHFKAHNRSAPWAEAYYRHPVCHAYYADGPNPVHWMIHEATHQLNRELAGFPRQRWVDEGLATYFGTSRIVDGSLQPGLVDANAYPIGWLSGLTLSGDLARDQAEGRLIPLRALIAGTGPDIGTRVNLYYLQFWSLSHFLFHHAGGRHAAAYRELIVAGGSLQDFERLIGPVESIEAQWYDYLRGRIAEARGADTEALPATRSGDGTR